MCFPRKSLNNCVPWTALLDLLGVRITTCALPTHAQCPICREGVMDIFEDHTVGGQWFHCRSCKKHGDMIELAARAWDVFVVHAIPRLHEHGFDIPTDIESRGHYIRQHVNYRRRLDQFRLESQQGFVHQSDTVQWLFSKFGIRCDPLMNDWTWRAGLTIGGAHRTEVERCFAPKVMANAERRQKSSPSAHAIFKGKGWDEVMVLPFYDLPRRVKAFLFVGREGNADGDFVFKLANYGPPSNKFVKPPVDLGLLSHPNLLVTASEWDHTIFGLSDPMLAMRLQTRHFEGSKYPPVP